MTCHAAILCQGSCGYVNIKSGIVTPVPKFQNCIIGIDEMKKWKKVKQLLYNFMLDFTFIQSF